jgi:hypothetical protein
MFQSRKESQVSCGLYYLKKNATNEACLCKFFKKQTCCGSGVTEYMNKLSLKFELGLSHATVHPSNFIMVSYLSG